MVERVMTSGMVMYWMTSNYVPNVLHRLELVISHDHSRVT